MFFIVKAASGCPLLVVILNGRTKPRPCGPWEFVGDKKMKKMITIALFMGASFAFAHSGGTDSNGCHHDRKTGSQHCH